MQEPSTRQISVESPFVEVVWYEGILRFFAAPRQQRHQVSLCEALMETHGCTNLVPGGAQLGNEAREWPYPYRNQIIHADIVSAFLETLREIQTRPPSLHPPSVFRNRPALKS